MQFEIGDIVKLKSGGPEMTVTKLDNQVSTDVGVMWFDGKTLHKGWMPEDAIVFAEARD